MSLARCLIEGRLKDLLFEVRLGLQRRPCAPNFHARQRRQRRLIVTSEPTRDPTTDHLLTPNNSALIIIDYQPLQVSSVASMDRRELVMNIVAVTRLAKL